MSARELLLRGKILFLMALAAALAFSQQTGGDPQIRIEPIRGHMYLIGGAGGNIIASIGTDGVLLVDSGLAQKRLDRTRNARQHQRKFG